MRTKNIIFLLISVIFGFFCLLAFFVMQAYPKKFEKEVFKYSKEFSLPSSLIFAIIKVESNFNPNAKSKVGALGLMQIMPQTAFWLTEKEENLFDPNTNIKLGCMYLKYLKTMFFSTSSLLCAYNAGPNKAKIWLEDEKYSQDGITILRTPYRETTTYINKVKHAQKVFKKLYKL